jgi:hypothetical protein
LFSQFHPATYNGKGKPTWIVRGIASRFPKQAAANRLPKMRCSGFEFHSLMLFQPPNTSPGTDTPPSLPLQENEMTRRYPNLLALFSKKRTIVSFSALRRRCI